MDKYKNIIRTIGMLIAIVSLLMVGYQLWSAWPTLRGLHMQAAPASLALVIISLNLTIAAILWRTILQQLGGTIDMPKAIRIWFVSQVVRYAPGNVWHLLGRAYLTQQISIPTQSSSLSMVFELLHVLTSGLIIATIANVFWQNEILSIATLLLIPFAVCYIWPQLLHRPLTLVLRRAGQQPNDLTIKRRHLVAILPSYCCIWLIYGGSLYLLANAVYPLPITTLPAITGIYAFAWVIGFLSFITPSGLGVREGILGYLFSFIMPAPIALLMAILARVWMTVGELLCVGLVFWRR
jgi:glycosyltransferase 2 family protein